MNKYKISKDIDVANSTSVMGKGKDLLNPKVMAAMAIAGAAPAMVGAAPVIGGAIAAKMIDNGVTVIKTLEELNEYSCVDETWDKNCIYVEHPRIPKRLIEARLYKDYILKEMMSEIFDFITDRVAVKKIVLGLENKGKMSAKASVPINNIVADASLSGSLNSSYISTAENVPCTHNNNREYPWLKYYPDIVAAVKKNAGKLEIKQTVKMDLEVGLGVQGMVKGAFNMDQEYSFYVYYEKV